MRMPRVSIAGAMLLVVGTSVAVAALRSPSPLWAGGFVVATLGALTYAMIGLLHARGPSRAYWSGFAVAGWMTIAVHYAPWFRENVTPMLGTTGLSDIAYVLLHRPASLDISEATPVADRTWTTTTDADGISTTVVTSRPIPIPAAPSDPSIRRPLRVTNFSPPRRAETYILPTTGAWTWWTTPRPAIFPSGAMVHVPIEFHYIFISIVALSLASCGGYAARRLAAPDAVPA